MIDKDLVDMVPHPGLTGNCGDRRKPQSMHMALAAVINEQPRCLDK